MNKQVLQRSTIRPFQSPALSAGRQITLGDGFSARSYNHADFSGLMDPLIMVDHFIMTEPTFGTHAHAGLSAVTAMLEDSEGAFRNRDSLGNDIDLAAGDLYWFKAARGAIHNEEPRPGARTHALQVFVNLPQKHRHDPPAAFHLPAKDIPRVPGERAEARLVLGESNGVKGASAPDLPLTLLDIKVRAGGRFLHEGANNQHAWILSIEGSAVVSWNGASTALQSGTAVALAGTADIGIASELGAHVVLFTGHPLREAFVQRGPFAMGSMAELDAAEADYRAGRLGSID
ncbi:redox-sensitive bicupin YhaK (pirin superfamily) [Labrenzia sp. EL_142]|nr:redox-sensitive bicupin YhaK (pirin superfamily) [Labrenzia sp. EL_142]